MYEEKSELLNNELLSPKPIANVVLPLVSLAVISWEYQPKLLVDVVCPVTSKSNVSGVPSLAFSCQLSNPWLKKLIVISDADIFSLIVSIISCVPGKVKQKFPATLKKYL